MSKSPCAISGSQKVLPPSTLSGSPRGLVSASSSSYMSRTSAAMTATMTRPTGSIASTRISTSTVPPSSTTPAQNSLVPASLRSIPGSCRWSGSTTPGDVLVRKGSDHILDHHQVFADSTIFKVFSLPMLGGDINTALNNPHSVVIDESAARRYFNSTDVRIHPRKAAATTSRPARSPGSSATYPNSRISILVLSVP